MAIKKAVTKDDITTSTVPDGVNPAPTYSQMVKRIEEHTAPEMVAEVKERKYTKLKSPTGSVTEVPNEMVESLLISGYSKADS